MGFWIADLRVIQKFLWFPLLLCLCPMFEIVFTIYYPVVLQKSHLVMQDALHLHQFINMRIVRPSVGGHSGTAKAQCNALA
jgi:UDP-GlcNAc:undecaprenyl-phosphate/decaprenyl-phosphate GlcNAc-1-phosphate transferase